MYFLLSCGEFGSPYLGKAQQPQHVHLADNTHTLQTTRTFRTTHTLCRQHVHFTGTTHTLQTARTLCRQHAHFTDTTHTLQTTHTLCRQHAHFADSTHTLRTPVVSSLHLTGRYVNPLADSRKAFTVNYQSSRNVPLSIFTPTPSLENKKKLNTEAPTPANLNSSYNNKNRNSKKTKNDKHKISETIPMARSVHSQYSGSHRKRVQDSLFWFPLGLRGRRLHIPTFPSSKARDGRAVC